MITPRIRPRLEMTVAFPPNELAARVEEHLHDPDVHVAGSVSREQIALRIREDERRFFSPQVVIQMTPEDEGSRLVGRFGPDAHVWTFFLAAHGFVILCVIFALFFGAAQLTMGNPPTAFWSLPIGVVLMILIYIAAGIGQRLGHDQVEILNRFLEESMGTA